MRSSYLIAIIKNNLTPDLLKPQYRKNGVHPTYGHCYVASEAFYHMMGKELGYKPCVLRIDENNTHWFLRNRMNVIDITKAQFRGRYPNISKSKYCGFLTKKPSKRASILIKRVNIDIRYQKLFNDMFPTWVHARPTECRKIESLLIYAEEIEGEDWQLYYTNYRGKTIIKKIYYFGFPLDKM